jgi:hypothetical protein
VRKAHQQQLEQPIFMAGDSPVGTVMEEDNPPTIATEPDSPILQRSVNFAAQAAGAVVLAKNPEAKGSKHLLNDDEDKYFMSPCSEPTFVVVGLSEDCIVQQLIISNYERYSSTVKDFLLLGSQAYPTKEWMVLGNFTAGDVQGEQSFDMQARKVWVRYIKLQWRSHFREEYYCTMTQVAVHGQTIMQDLHEVVSPSIGEQIEAPPTVLPPQANVATSSADSSEQVSSDGFGSASAGDASNLAVLHQVDTVPAPMPPNEAKPGNTSDPSPKAAVPALNCTSLHLHCSWNELMQELVKPIKQEVLPTNMSSSTSGAQNCHHPSSTWPQHFTQLAAHGARMITANESFLSRQQPILVIREQDPLPMFKVFRGAATPHHWGSCHNTHEQHPLSRQYWSSCAYYLDAISTKEQHFYFHTASVHNTSASKAAHGQETASKRVAAPDNATIATKLANSTLCDHAEPTPAQSMSASAVLPTTTSHSAAPVQSVAPKVTTPSTAAAPPVSSLAPKPGSAMQDIAPSELSPSAPASAAQQQPPPAASQDNAPAGTASPTALGSNKGSPAQTLFKQLRSQVKDLELQQDALDSYLDDFRSAYDSLMASVQSRLDNASATLETLQATVAAFKGELPHLHDQLRAYNASITQLQGAANNGGRQHLTVFGSATQPFNQDSGEDKSLQLEEVIQFYALVAVVSMAISAVSCLVATAAMCCR